MIALIISIITIIVCLNYNCKTYRYNLFYRHKYKEIKSILNLNPELFKVIYIYDGYIKLEHRNIPYILYGNIKTKRASIFFDKTCIVSTRPTESKKIYTKFCAKYLEK